jgi:hypothetical protein
VCGNKNGKDVDGSICKFDGIKQVTGPSNICFVIQSLKKLDHIIIIIIIVVVVVVVVVFIELGSLVTE